MNIRHISFDKVIIKSKSKMNICYNAMVRLYPIEDKMMGGDVAIEGYRQNNVQRPNAGSESNYVFINWQLISFDSWNLKFKCKGAVGNKLMDYEVCCIYSLPLKDDE